MDEGFTFSERIQAQELILGAASEAEKNGTAPAYLIDLRDCLNQLFPRRYRTYEAPHPKTARRIRHDAKA